LAVVLSMIAGWLDAANIPPPPTLAGGRNAGIACPTTAPPERAVELVTVGSLPNDPMEEQPARTSAATPMDSAEAVPRSLGPVIRKVMGMPVNSSTRCKQSKLVKVKTTLK